MGLETHSIGPQRELAPSRELALLKASHLLITAPTREAWPSLRVETGTAAQVLGPGPAPAFPREDSQLFLARSVQ